MCSQVNVIGMLEVLGECDNKQSPLAGLKKWKQATVPPTDTHMGKTAPTWEAVILECDQCGRAALSESGRDAVTI